MFDLDVLKCVFALWCCLGLSHAVNIRERLKKLLVRFKVKLVSLMVSEYNAVVNIMCNASTRQITYENTYAESPMSKYML